MQIKQEELADGVTKVTLEGSLDIAGAAAVDMPLNIIAGSKRKVLLDFTQVDFLASIGIRTLVQVARTVGSRGGKVVLMNANEAAKRVLVSTGVDSIIALVDGDEAAHAAFA